MGIAMASRSIAGIIVKVQSERVAMRAKIPYCSSECTGFMQKLPREVELVLVLSTVITGYILKSHHLGKGGFS